MPQYLSESVKVNPRLLYVVKETSTKFDPNLSTKCLTYTVIKIPFRFYCYIFYVLFCCVTYFYKIVHAMKFNTILINLNLLPMKLKSILNTILIKSNSLIMKCKSNLYAILNFYRPYMLLCYSKLYTSFNAVLLVYYTRYKYTIRIHWIPQYIKFYKRTRDLYLFAIHSVSRRH